MFAVPTILIDSFLTKAGIVVFGLIQAELFSIHSRFSERSECVVGAKRKLRFLYCITSQNTFIQCQPRMNRALAERCTVRPRTSCRASYGIPDAEKSAGHLATILQNVVCLQCDNYILTLLLQWRIVISAYITGGAFLNSFSLYKQLECGCRRPRKLRLSFLFNFHNTFIQCDNRMNCALAERCTVRPKTSCRASYATNSRPTSWPVTLKPGESACRATPATAIRRAPSSLIVGHSSSGPSPSRSSASTCRALMTPASGNANPSAPGPCRSGVSNNVSYENR